jgi:hypothetical protein
MVPAGRRRLIGLAVLRSLTTAIVLVGLYYLLPLDHLAGVPLAVILVAGLLVLLAVAAWQLRLVIGARYRPRELLRPWPRRCRCSCCCSPRPIS